jgi:hypothetical protein
MNLKMPAHITVNERMPKFYLEHIQWAVRTRLHILLKERDNSLLTFFVVEKSVLEFEGCERGWVTLEWNGEVDVAEMGEFGQSCEGVFRLGGGQVISLEA